ncbi:hypothetical protein M3S04_00765 [Xanthomonas sp. PPL139]|uniref:hypothetical protein n=1 Tax=unclassified Xanthomonas TaxID=2643310 RepID=UPI0033A9B75E
MSKHSGFGLFTMFYFAIFIGMFLAAPLLLMTPWHARNPNAWLLSLGAMGVLLSLLLLCHRQCSGPSLSFTEGLLFVTGFMMTGWSMLSAVFVFPALLLVTLAAIIVSAACLPLGGRTRSATLFHRLVLFVYRHRLIQ